MRKVLLIWPGLLLSLLLVAQEEKEKPKEDAGQAEINAEVEERDQDQDTSKNNENKEDVGEQTSEEDKDLTTTPSAVNTPGVSSYTTSSSGSPAVISEHNGEGRDGTNTVQRATLNIAGAEIPGVQPQKQTNPENVSSEQKKSKKQDRH